MPASIEEELTRVLSSRAFAGAKSLSEFLRYVVEASIEGRADQIKEYVIGVEVFGRGADFDPRTDTIVRVQAVNLRTRLARYYETDGAASTERIVLPKGGYVPRFEQRSVPASVRPRRRRIIAAIAAGLLAVALSAAGIGLYQRARRQTSISSLAVLPFLNLTGNPQNEYLSDGLTEELLDHLTQIEGLRVPARTSSFRFKNKAGDIGEIGRSLNVAAVLEGSVRNNGARLRVTAQLNRVKDGYHLWSGSFEADLKDTLRLEQDLARAIVAELGNHGVSPAASQPVAREPRTHEAYNLYLQGRYFWNKRTEQGFHKAVQLFGEAVAMDPEYARAWIGLADAHILLIINGHAAPRDTLPQAEAAVARALALDESLAEAHAAKATLLTAQGKGDPVATEIEYRRAIALNAGYASAHQWYSRFLAERKRLEESLHEIRIAEDLDPVSPIISHARGLTLLAMGRTDDAVAAWRRAIELDPGFPPSLEYLAGAYFRNGDCGAALATQEKAATGSGELRRRAVLGELKARCGNRPEAARILKEVTAASQDRYISPWYVIQLAMALGEKNVALDELERACREQHFFVRRLRTNATLAPLSSEPRFEALLKKSEARSAVSR